MHPTDEELRKAVALCRYGLIADVLRVPLGSRALHEKAQRTYVIPGSRRTRVAVETMRDWLSLYRNGAFEALYPRHRSAPFPALSTCGEGNNRTLLPHPSRHLARPPQRRGHREPSDVEPHPVGLGRGRAPPPPPPRTQRAHPARPRRARRARRALPRPRHRPRRPLPLRGQTPGHERPNGEPQRTTLRGRRRARRRTRHLALRPPRAACAPHRGRPRRQGRRRRHPPRRLPQPPASSATAPPGSPTAIPHRRSRLPRPWRCDTSSEKP